MPGFRPSPAIPCLLAVLAGCADDDGALADTTVASSESSGATSIAAADSTGAPAFDVGAEVTTYDSQPMVVDVTLTLSAPGTATVSHASDAGVVASPHAGGDDTHLVFRVRGLAPDTTHTLQYTVTPTGGGVPVDGTVDVTTPAALPGFIAAFELETTATPAEPLYRLFDLNPFPAGDFCGAAMIDPSGITRWFLGEATTLTGPPAVWAAVKLRPDGTIMYVHGETFFLRDELGNTLVEIPAADMGLPSLHHDVLELDNGNFLAFSLAFQDIDYGVDGIQHVAGDLVVEFTPAGEVVWTWNSFDHLDPQRRRVDFDTPGLVDPDGDVPAKDWTHANGMIYEPETDTLVVSLRHQDWILRIDRASGDVLWRLGDEGDFTLADGDRWFFHQHSPQWQPDGSLMLYDNGNGNPDIADADVHSRAVRFDLDLQAMTAAVAWQDDEPFYQVLFAGDADHMPGGHYLVTDTAFLDGDVIHGRLREVDPAASPTRIWSIITPPNHFIYRTTAHDRLVGQAQ